MKKRAFNQSLWNKIRAIDLNRVWQRLIVKEGYTAERADAAILGYRQYLYLLEVRGNISPTPDVDDVWHAHFSFMASYVRDCMLVFGRIIYHMPNQITEAEVSVALAKNGNSRNARKAVVKTNVNCMESPPEGECGAEGMSSDGGFIFMNVQAGRIQFTTSVPIDEYADNPTTAFALADFEQMIEEVF